MGKKHKPLQMKTIICLGVIGVVSSVYASIRIALNPLYGLLFGVLFFIFAGFFNVYLGLLNFILVQKFVKKTHAHRTATILYSALSCILYTIIMSRLIVWGVLIFGRESVRICFDVCVETDRASFANSIPPFFTILNSVTLIGSLLAYPTVEAKREWELPA